MSERLPALGVFFVRVTLGAIGFLRGLYDGFGMFGGPGLDVLTRYLDNHGVFWPSFMALVVVAVELVVGLMLVLGSFHRFAGSVALAFALLAILVEGRTRTFFLEERGCEYLLALAAMAACVLLAGPGRPALQVRVQPARE
jgi:putative oxidoreductase